MPLGSCSAIDIYTGTSNLSTEGPFRPLLVPVPARGDDLRPAGDDNGMRLPIFLNKLDGLLPVGVLCIDLGVEMVEQGDLEADNDSLIE
jgi:hypothetical protein